jgi:putative ABC transport system permease protein
MACAWGAVFLVIFESLLQELRRIDLEWVTRASLNERLLGFPGPLESSTARQLDLLQIPGISLFPCATLTSLPDGKSLAGVTRSYFNLKGLKLVQGRAMDLTDILAGTQTCWIPASMRESLPDAQEVDIDGKPFQVVGTYDLRRQYHPLIGVEVGKLGPWDEKAILIPLSAATRLLPDRTGGCSLMVQVSDPSILLDSWDDVTLSLEELGLDTKQATDSQTQELPSWLDTQFAEARRVFAVSEGLIFFFAWANAANLMLRQVRQRTREIGIMMSVGASPEWIRRHFLREALLVGVLAGLVAWAVGTGSVLAVGRLIQWDIHLNMDALKLGLLSGMVAAFTTALVPAWWASKRLPAEALKHQ